MILGINETDMLDNSKVKIIDGIAGCGKSQALDEFFKQNNIKYLRLTSTNTLKKDAEARFGGTVKTICAGIFDNTNGFRTAEKEIDFDTVVLDEVLQDGWQALRWVMNHAGTGINIILTTDSRQMLAPESEEYVIKVFEELKNKSYTIYSVIDKTLRGVNKETRDEVTKLYKINGFVRGSIIMKEYKTINLEDLDYNVNDVCLTHTLEIEHYLYKNLNFTGCELIGKGQQSGKEPIQGKYPLYDEMTAKQKNVVSYYQNKLVATPTRYQGSEVQPGQRGFYFIESCSVVSMRELYTVISRFKDINSFTIVNCDGFEKTKELIEFKGMKVKEMRPCILNTFDGKMHIVKTDDIIDIIDKNQETQYYYSLDVVYSLVDDKLFVQYVNEKNLQTIRNTHCMTIDGILYIDLNDRSKMKYKSLASTLSKKTPSIQYDFMPSVYEIIGETFKAPMLNNKYSGNKTDYERQADIFSAYGTIIKNSKMPTTKCLYTQYDKDKLNWYISNNEKLSGKNNLITEDLAKCLDFVDCKYVFTTDYQISNEVGDYVYNQSRKSKEDKKATSKLHWGYYEKHYIDMNYTGHKNNEEYVIERVPCLNKNNINELFMCAVKSALAAIMYKARESVGGGYVITDAIYYNGEDLPDFPDWVWFRVSQGKVSGEYENVEYQNYEDLKTKQQLKYEKEKAKRGEETEEERVRREKRREQQKARRANETPEQREARLAKAREYKARTRQS